MINMSAEELKAALEGWVSMMKGQADTFKGEERTYRRQRANEVEINIDYYVAHVTRRNGHLHWCSKCGAPEGATYMEPTATKLIEDGLCFHCNFLLERVAHHKSSKGSSLLVKGTFYTDAGMSGDRSAFLGFGGRLFTIKMKEDGRVFQTNNLWCQGYCPEFLREGVEDNAEFLV